jgi:hypothetical protein
MKYLMTYEKHKTDGDYYWYIPYTDKELIFLTVKKIPVQEYVQDSIIMNIKKILSRYKTIDHGIYIGIQTNVQQTHVMGKTWMFFDCNLIDEVESGKKFLEKQGYQYKGDIKLDDWQIASNQYNI